MDSGNPKLNMLERFWRSYLCRTFSRSSVQRNLEKAKPPEPSTPAPKPNEEFIDMSMTTVPTEFEKRILLLSGKYKTREEIPPRVRFETMNMAKSKVRIKGANILMALTILACFSVIYMGKKRRAEGRTIMKELTENEERLREEGRLRKLKEQ